MNYINMLPLSVDYELDRYTLFVVYAEHNEDIVKVYYKSKDKILQIDNYKFLFEGEELDTVNNIMSLLVTFGSRLIISSEKITNLRDYAREISLLLNNIMSINSEVALRRNN